MALNVYTVLKQLTNLQNSLLLAVNRTEMTYVVVFFRNSFFC